MSVSRFMRMKTVPMIRTSVCSSAYSCVFGRPHEEEADAGCAEDDLNQEGTAKDQADGVTEHCDDRQDAVVQHVLDHDPVG